MKLTQLLAHPGTHIWPFQQESGSLKTFADAHRRLQAYKAEERFRGKIEVAARGLMLTDLDTYKNELVLEVTVTPCR